MIRKINRKDLPEHVLRKGIENQIEELKQQLRGAVSKEVRTQLRGRIKSLIQLKPRG